MKFASGVVLGFVLCTIVFMIGLKGKVLKQPRSLVFLGEKALKKPGSPDVDFFRVEGLDDVSLMVSRDELGRNITVVRKSGSFPSAIIWLDSGGPVQVEAINGPSQTVVVNHVKGGSNGPFDRLTVKKPKGDGTVQLLEDTGIDGTYNKTMTLGTVTRSQ